LTIWITKQPTQWP